MRAPVIEELSLALPALGRSAEEVDPAQLVHAHAALLFRVAHSVVRNRAEAEDVVQDAFVRVMEHRKSLPEIRDPRVWLVRITWNLALDRRRRIRPDQMDEIFAGSLASRTVSAERQFAVAERMSAVMRELERLPKTERQVLLLAGIEELSNGEIAAVMGKSDSAVRALLFRARTRLKERLERGGRR